MAPVSFFPDGLKEKKKRGIVDAVVFMVHYLPDRKKIQYVFVIDNYYKNKNNNNDQQKY